MSCLVDVKASTDLMSSDLSDVPPWSGFEGVVTTLCDGKDYGVSDDVNESLSYPRWICADLPSSQVSLPHELDLLNSIKEALKTLKEFPTPISMIVRDFAIPRLAYLTDDLGLRSIDIESGDVKMLVRSTQELQTPCVDPKNRSVYFTNKSQILRLDRQTTSSDATPFEPAQPTTVTSLSRILTQAILTPAKTTIISKPPTTTVFSKITTISGQTQIGFRDGSVLRAEFNFPRLVPFSSNGNELIVYDSENYRMRLIDMKAGSVTTIAGNGVLPEDWQTPDRSATASLGCLLSIIYDPLHAPSSNEPADLIFTTKSSSLRRFNRRTGSISSMQLKTPCDIIGTPSGWYLVTSSTTIYACEPQTGRLIQLAGSPFRAGFRDGPAFAAMFNYIYQPLYVPPTMVGESPSLLIPDASSNAIRRLALAPFFAIPPPTQNAS